MPRLMAECTAARAQADMRARSLEGNAFTDEGVKTLADSFKDCKKLKIIKYGDWRDGGWAVARLTTCFDASAPQTD